jgi:hypothetical protein
MYSHRCVVASRAQQLERRDGRGEDTCVLLAAHLEHLAVRVGVDAAHERWAARRAVLGEEPAGLEAHAARVAQRLGALGPRAPLRGLLHAAVAAAPVPWGARAGELSRVLRLAPALLRLVLAASLAVLGVLRRWRRGEEEVVAVTLQVRGAERLWVHQEVGRERGGRGGARGSGRGRRGGVREQRAARDGPRRRARPLAALRLHGDQRLRRQRADGRRARRAGRRQQGTVRAVVRAAVRRQRRAQQR